MRSLQAGLRALCGAGLVRPGHSRLAAPSTPLAIIGVLGALTTGALLRQRECLVGVTYRHKLSETRATFDGRVTLEIEIVNDKLLPLSWLRAEEVVPFGSPSREATSSRLIRVNYS